MSASPTTAANYSRVPNKRGGGESNRGEGLEMVRYNNNRGVRIIGGGGGWRNRKLPFSKVKTHLLHIYLNSDVTDTFTFELWFC